MRCCCRYRHHPCKQDDSSGTTSFEVCDCVKLLSTRGVWWAAWQRIIPGSRVQKSNFIHFIYAYFVIYSVSFCVCDNVINVFFCFRLFVCVLAWLLFVTLSFVFYWVSYQVEMFAVVRPEDSETFFGDLVEIQKEIYSALNMHFKCVYAVRSFSGAKRNVFFLGFQELRALTSLLQISHQR